MSFEEKLQLRSEMMRKKIKQTELAKLIKKSDAWVSVCLADKEDFNEDDEQLILSYVFSN